MENIFSDEYFMKQALTLAEQAYEEKEVPVGAVVVAGNKIIGKGYNQTEKLNDPTAHAEMLALTAAFHSMNAKYLEDCTLYVTLEPCVMCAGALYWSQVSKVVYAAPDEKRGYTNHGNLLHPKTAVVQGPLGIEASGLLKCFFQERRKK